MEIDQPTKAAVECALSLSLFDLATPLAICLSRGGEIPSLPLQSERRVEMPTGTQIKTTLELSRYSEEENTPPQEIHPK